MMRIIAGTYKGRVLATVRDGSVRPATDRIKGSIFNMLQNRLNLIDADILDLFAGSGSLGLEALSRGAARVVFVETNKDAFACIETNADKLGCADECEVLQVNCLDFISRARDTFDLIFADPPYAYGETPKLPWLIFSRGLLREEGILIIEHSKRTEFLPDPLYVRTVHKKFGGTEISFFAHPEKGTKS